ncbi:MAG TPA: M48 family metalloprotease [Kofleriaceae bacterium]|nr:M48 family metalloprotease [Kofleriaceae bacterium]
MIRAAAVIGLAGLAAAACATPRPATYLDARVPAPCTAHDVEGCLGWMIERDLAAELDLYDDANLRGYVQAIADRLARVSHLARAPRVVISDHDGTYSTSGSRIVVARATILRLASEAELAGVIAHELAHLEGHHAVISLFGPPPDDDAVTARRDAEAIADERAVALLERAGYAPTAMARALRAVLDFEDDDHPLRADRVARVAVLAGDRPGFEGRDALLHHLAHLVVGRDSRLGRRVDDVWVIAALGLALDLAPGDVIRAAQDALVLRRGRATLALYPIGAPWARALAAALDARSAEDRPLGQLTLGRMPLGDAAPGPALDDPALAHLARAVHATLPRPPAGTTVAILERAGGGLVIELAGAALPALGLRRATAGELAAAEPPRVVIEHAARAGTAGDAAICAGRLLDDPARPVAAGAPIKCADRALTYPRR